MRFDDLRKPSAQGRQMKSAAAAICADGCGIGVIVARLTQINTVGVECLFLLFPNKKARPFYF
jgi:hypothetical protein